MVHRISSQGWPDSRRWLLIDEDCQGGAAQRVGGGGFYGGEAGNDRAGERTALRIKPDAIIAEQMVGAPGMTVCERLCATGGTIPCYIVSTAAEALVGSVGLPEIGVAG
jgi:hypothetical protein